MKRFGDDEKYVKMICEEKFVKKFGDDEKFVRISGKLENW